MNTCIMYIIAFEESQPITTFYTLKYYVNKKHEITINMERNNPLFYYQLVELYQSFINNDTKVFYLLYIINKYVKNKTRKPQRKSKGRSP